MDMLHWPKLSWHVKIIVDHSTKYKPQHNDYKSVCDHFREKNKILHFDLL